MAENGTKPQFNFRKMGYNHERIMSRLSLEITHLGKQVQSADSIEETNTLIEQIEQKERESILMALKIVTYLPDEYLIEGHKIDYEDPESILDNVCFGAIDRIMMDIAIDRKNYQKKSMGHSE